MTKGFVKFVWADAVSMPAAFEWASPVSRFECLRRLMGYARFWVYPSPEPVEGWLRRFYGLRPFLGFYG